MQPSGSQLITESTIKKEKERKKNILRFRHFVNAAEKTYGWYISRRQCKKPRSKLKPQYTIRIKGKSWVSSCPRQPRFEVLQPLTIINITIYPKSLALTCSTNDANHKHR